MTKLCLRDAIEQRRTYYSIDKNIKITDAEIENIIRHALTNVPSAFNSQTTRVVLLLGENHTKLWDIVKNTLKARITPEQFKGTEAKINGAFASGYGTILFFEDQDDVKGLQEAFPSYASSFPHYSEQTAGMHQYAIWTMLKEVGIGASLQHYQPLIDEEVAKTWNLKPSWKLIAQMPFGNPVNEPDAKTSKPLDELLKVFK